MYIWQRVWTPELSVSIGNWSKKLSGLKILSGYFERGKYKSVDIKWNEIPKKTNLTLVFRINGVKLPALDEISALINKQISKAKQNSHHIDYIEIDFDSPTSKLDVYQKWLSQLKNQLSNKIKISITALPTWQHSEKLNGLLSVVDHYVLQVHSVDSPEQGLVDFAGAVSSVIYFSENYNKPFVVSLPNYWYRAALDNNNNIKAILAESQLIDSPGLRQIFAEPAQLLNLKLDIEKMQLKNLMGWVWFRMPTSNDKQIFAEVTMNKLIVDQMQWSLIPINLQFSPVNPEIETSNYDIYIENKSSIEQVISTTLEIPKECEAQHLTKDFEFENNQIKAKYQTLFRANETLRIGWMVCN